MFIATVHCSPCIVKISRQYLQVSNSLQTENLPNGDYCHQAFTSNRCPEILQVVSRCDVELWYIAIEHRIDAATLHNTGV